jgi:hypothetical protein
MITKKELLESGWGQEIILAKVANGVFKYKYFHHSDYPHIGYTLKQARQAEAERRKNANKT